MAEVIFSSRSGQVVSFVDPAVPSTVSMRLENWGGYRGFKSLISRVSVAARGNYQFLHTLGGQVYIYVFGDRLGQLSVSGLSFESTCDSRQDRAGVEHVLQYYNQHRLSARSVPVRMTIGASTALTAYLVGINADVVDPKARIWQFTLEAALIPADAGRAKYRPSGGGLLTSTSPATSTTSISSGATAPSLPATLEQDTGGQVVSEFPQMEVVHDSYEAGRPGPTTQLVEAVRT